MLVGFAALGLAACGTVPTRYASVPRPSADAERKFVEQLVLEEAVSEEKRLETVSYRLLRGAADLCGKKVTRRVGLVTATASDFADAARRAARVAFGADGRLRVLDAVPGSPAEAAGLKQGEAIVGVNGRALPPGSAAKAVLKETLGQARGGPSVLTVRDSGRLREVALQPETVCDIPIEMSESKDVNAWADTGGRIRVSRGMLRFVRSDSELALLLSHEMGHIIMNHAGSYLGYMAAPEKFEAEADYVGLYVMARAGYDMHDGLNLLRRMAVSFGYINDTPTHPATMYRYLMMKKAIDEIRAKKEAGKPLTFIRNPARHDG